MDEYLRRDPASRVRLSVTGGRGVMFVAGDVLSHADFDVSALVKRTLGSFGITDEIEPFVALEGVTSERTGVFRLSNESPVTVTGYATSETENLLPQTVAAAHRLARLLQEARERDPEWFWLGPDAEVTVIAKQAKPHLAVINVEQGGEPLEKVRAKIAEKLKTILDGMALEVNRAGVCERRGLGEASGASGRTPGAYGSMIPSRPGMIGCDPTAAEKAGVWLARAAAIRLVRGGVKAALVQATYLPGEVRPSIVQARDERGQDLAAKLPADSLLLEKVIKEWWRPGLNVDAAYWGLAGDRALPWEM